MHKTWPNVVNRHQKSTTWNSHTILKKTKIQFAQQSTHRFRDFLNQSIDLKFKFSASTKDQTTFFTQWAFNFIHKGRTYFFLFLYKLISDMHIFSESDFLLLTEEIHINVVAAHSSLWPIKFYVFELLCLVALCLIAAT